VDDEERQAVRADGFNPDDPAVVAAIDVVRWELSRLPRKAQYATGSIPVSRTSITAGKSMFLVQNFRRVHVTSTTALAVSPVASP
jgi:hypothetical protein